MREIRVAGGSPAHGIQLSNGRIVVTQTGALHGVCLVGDDGQILKSYGNKAGSTTGQFSSP